VSFRDKWRVSPTLIGRTDDAHAARRIDHIVSDGGKVVDIHESLDLYE
jgi:hypothetical protein